MEELGKPSPDTLGELSFYIEIATHIPKRVEATSCQKVRKEPHFLHLCSSFFLAKHEPSCAPALISVLFEIIWCRRHSGCVQPYFPAFFLSQTARPMANGWGVFRSGHWKAHVNLNAEKGKSIHTPRGLHVAGTVSPSKHKTNNQTLFIDIRTCPSKRAQHGSTTKCAKAFAKQHTHIYIYITLYNYKSSPCFLLSSCCVGACESSRVQGSKRLQSSEVQDDPMLVPDLVRGDRLPDLWDLWKKQR